MKKFVLVLAAVLVARQAPAVRVTVAYEAEAATVVGQPFGMTVPRLTIVRGYLTYETSTPDLSPADLMRGKFFLNGTWDFRAEFLGKVVTGSKTATSSTELFGYTLRFEDGAGSTDPNVGNMSLDGVPDENIGLGFSIVGEAKDLPTDQLPERFTFDPPPSGASHTFVLSSSSTDKMLLQFRSFSQVAITITSIQPVGEAMRISWPSFEGKLYDIEYSTDLIGWHVVRTGVAGLSLTTSATVDLAAHYPESPLPPVVFYRVIDRPPPLSG